VGDRQPMLESSLAGHARSARAAGRRAAPKGEADTNPLLRLQQAAGNRAVVAALGQAKLEVGRVDDPLEAEADEMASRVVQMLQSSSDGVSPSGGSALGHANEGLARTIRRRPYTPGQSSPAGGLLDGDVEQALTSARSGGTPLPGIVRSRMENAFEADFSGVKVHRGAAASELSGYLGAKAFTVGGDIFLRDGMPDTATTGGQSLLAHELAHTVQQGASAPLAARQVQREEDDSLLDQEIDSDMEMEAEEE
jgi:Domain of unknown function (DUF4157)